MTAIQHPHEPISNTDREQISRYEPRTLRTFTPSQAVLVQSAGVYHWTPEGRRLYDFTSGVLVANLGHNPTDWMKRFCDYMGWSDHLTGHKNAHTPTDIPPGYFSAVTMTAYNAITEVETLASRRLVDFVQRCRGGKRLNQVMWAASGSEAIQKALWAAMARDRSRSMILATRYGFHGKKGLAGAVTGSETDAERDPRVRFVSFPMAECKDVSLRDDSFDPAPYRKELDALKHQFGQRLGVFITEPYLGGGGSYHPPKAYLTMVQQFCRENDIIFILDEVQANFGRTGDRFAFESYGLEPDLVVLGKGLGNGVPVAAAMGRSDLFAALDFGEGSDTWSANPLCCAAVLATLDAFESDQVLDNCHRASAIIEEHLVALKELPFVAHVRGEKGGMVWGVEFRDWNGKTGPEWANESVLACYRGDGSHEGIHILGPLAKKVVRISPPLTITEAEARAAMDLMHRCLKPLAAPTHAPIRGELAGVN